MKMNVRLNRNGNTFYGLVYGSNKSVKIFVFDGNVCKKIFKETTAQKM